MNIKEATDALKVIGWVTGKDDVGDRNAKLHLADRSARIIYGIERIRDRQKFSAMLSVTTDIFSIACKHIYPDSYNDSPLIRAFKGVTLYAPELTGEHIRQISDQCIAWAKEQDLEAGLLAHAELPTTAPGARPIWHLAALAVIGDVEKLKFYQISFADGDRLGFVPYITKDHIDRALKFASDQAT